MDWLQDPYINLPYVAGQLYGSCSRLHTRKLQDRLKGRFTFNAWEIERLTELKERIRRNLEKETERP